MSSLDPRPQRQDMRLASHDYSAPGHYFVTIVTRERRHVLGDVRFDRVLLSALGRVVEAEWLGLARRFPSVRVGMHVIMPNHVHGLLELVEMDSTRPRPTLSRVIGAFKGAATLRARVRHLHGWRPLWQRGFHDRVVRDGLEHEVIQRYIEANPLNWPQDPERG